MGPAKAAQIDRILSVWTVIVSQLTERRGFTKLLKFTTVNKDGVLQQADFRWKSLLGGFRKSVWSVAFPPAMKYRLHGP